MFADWFPPHEYLKISIQTAVNKKNILIKIGHFIQFIFRICIWTFPAYLIL